MVRVERDTTLSGMVPADVGPRCGPVAGFTLVPQPRLKAIVLSSYPMTVEAGVGSATILAAQVARLAGDRLMLSIEAERQGVVKRAIRSLELRIGARGRAHDQQQRRQDQSERSGHGRWHVAQLGPSAPRWMSVWQDTHFLSIA